MVLETYKIVKDEVQALDFINWLPDLEDNEKFYFSLFARKKYSSGLIDSNDRTQLKRFTTNKERMLDKIYQLELPLGRWKLKNIVAPQESLVLYMHPNPRCMKEATYKLGSKCWNLIKSKNYNIHAEALSAIQKSKSRSWVVSFDIDNKEADMSLMEGILPGECYNILETRGGYHILVHPHKVPYELKNKWYMGIKNAYPDDLDLAGDGLMPVPGCVQGGFVPKMLHYADEKV